MILVKQILIFPPSDFIQSKERLTQHRYEPHTYTNAALWVYGRELYSKTIAALISLIIMYYPCTGNIRVVEGEHLKHKLLLILYYHGYHLDHDFLPHFIY